MAAAHGRNVLRWSARIYPQQLGYFRLWPRRAGNFGRKGLGAYAPARLVCGPLFKQAQAPDRWAQQLHAQLLAQLAGQGVQRTLARPALAAGVNQRFCVALAHHQNPAIRMAITATTISMFLLLDRPDAMATGSST